MKKNRILTGILSISAATLLAACSTDIGSQESAAESEASSIESIAEESSMSGMDEMEGNDMEGMVHDDSGEIPEGLKEAENPTYNVGETATITDGHMEGMEGAEATIVGAFDTVAYEVTYQPTNGGEVVDNHRWVIQEEITEAKDQVEPLEIGSEVTLEAKHM